MIHLKKFTSLLIILLMGSSFMHAQIQQGGQMQQKQVESDVSDEEVKQFTEAFKSIQEIDQKTQQKMVSSVQEKGLDVQRFTEMQQAEQDPAAEVEATDEELENYNSASKELKKIQKEAQGKMEAEIKDKGLSLTRYQEIAEMVNKDPELQEKIKEYLKG